jgi:hypothetical protein
MKLVSLVTAILLSASAPSLAQETDFPMRADGAAREAFLKSQAEGCRQGIAYGPMVEFCQCYAVALAQIITGEESAALATGQISDSLHKKLRIIGSECKARYFR